MHKHKYAKYALIGFIAVLVIIAAFLLGWRHGLDNLSIKQITPTQAANAMQGDHFYSDYGENALLVRGTVAASNNNPSNLIVTFITGTGYNAACNFGVYRASFRPGEIITALSMGALAQRQPSGVMLQNCVIPQ